MRNQNKEPITGDYKVQPTDDERSLFLVGSSAQTITGPDVVGAAKAREGFSFRVYNRGAQDATFVPISPQTPPLTIAAGQAATLELGPDNIWSRS